MAGNRFQPAGPGDTGWRVSTPPVLGLMFYSGKETQSRVASGAAWDLSYLLSLCKDTSYMEPHLNREPGNCKQLRGLMGVLPLPCRLTLFVATALCILSP